MSLIAELKRRNVFKVGTAYLALAWVVVQMTDTVAPAIGLPAATLPLVIWIGAIGFPFALLFAWIYELTPEGLKRESEIDRSQSSTRINGRKLDYTIIGLLVAAIAVTALDRLLPRGEVAAAVPARVASGADGEADRGQVPLPRQETAPAPEPATAPPDARSIAVLPFVNMSSDKEQEYFSDGISEELLNLLTKIPELRVTSRSSAFSFKGRNLELPEIARRLGVAHILEGSVRKSGNKVRITAQLIDMRSDTHLWSATWDREMTDIFAVQDEIAGAVVEQLKIELLGAAPKTRATDPQAYALFLQARQLGRQFTAASWIQSNALYEEALRLDPGYAAALDGIATNYINQAATGQMPSEEAYRLAREYVDRELAIDPDYALAHDNLGWIAMAYELDMAAAVGHFQRALALEPGNLDVIGHAGVLAFALGRLEQSIGILEYNVARDPLNISAISNLADNYLHADRTEDALRLMNTVLNLSPERIGARAALGSTLLYRGDADGALESVSAESDPISRLQVVARVQHARGDREASDAALEQMIAAHAASAPYRIATVYACRGEADRAFEWLERAAVARDPSLIGLLGDRDLGSLRADPRWLPFLRKLRMAPEQLDPIVFEVALPG